MIKPWNIQHDNSTSVKLLMKTGKTQKILPLVGVWCVWCVYTWQKRLEMCRYVAAISAETDTWAGVLHTAECREDPCSD